MKLKPVLQFLAIKALAGVLVTISLSFTSAMAQGFYSPILYGNYSLYGSSLPYPGGNSLSYYGSLGGLTGGIDPLFGGYYGSPLSPMSPNVPYYSSMSPCNRYYPMMQIYAAYDYLNYALHFYELASQTPMLYLYDQSADYIGANLYNYAANIGVSPQESILYFIKDNFLSPQQQ
jgi:hypothetical protein